MTINRIVERVIRHLEMQSATEAFTVAEMLETIASNDDSAMQTPKFLAGCCEELAGWAESARQMLATGRAPIVEPPHALL